MNLNVTNCIFSTDKRETNELVLKGLKALYMEVKPGKTALLSSCRLPLTYKGSFIYTHTCRHITLHIQFHITICLNLAYDAAFCLSNLKTYHTTGKQLNKLSFFSIILYVYYKLFVLRFKMLNLQIVYRPLRYGIRVNHSLIMSSMH